MTTQNRQNSNAATFWDPYKLNHIKAIEQAQHRAAHVVLNDCSMKTPGCVTKMLSYLNRESLEQRRRHRLLSMMYKICINLVGTNAGSFIYSSDARTRGQHRLFQEIFTDQVLANTFFPEDNTRMERPPSQKTICT